MAKKKNTQNPRKRAQRVPIPRALKLTPTGASLAAYHAALSDPFASPPTYIPTGSRPGTYVHKRLSTMVAPVGTNYFSLKLWSSNPINWRITAYAGETSGSTAVWEMIAADGKTRIVGAAIRVTDVGPADSLGGIATCSNKSSYAGSQVHVAHHIYKKSVTAHYKPVFPSDFSWFGGNAGNDDYGNIAREVIVQLDPAVPTKTYVEFCIIFENDELLLPIEGTGNYLVGKRAASHDADTGVKHVARHATMGQKQRQIDMRDHGSSRGPSFVNRLADGIRAAAESGATVMGVTETLNPGSVSGPFKKYLGLGEASEAEVMATAYDTVPLLDAAIDFAPLAIML